MSVRVARSSPAPAYTVNSVPDACRRALGERERHRGAVGLRAVLVGDAGAERGLAAGCYHIAAVGFRFYACGVRFLADSGEAPCRSFHGACLGAAGMVERHGAVFGVGVVDDVCVDTVLAAHLRRGNVGVHVEVGLAVGEPAVCHEVRYVRGAHRCGYVHLPLKRFVEYACRLFGVGALQVAQCHIAPVVGGKRFYGLAVVAV